MAPTAFAMKIDRVTMVLMVADGTINLSLAIFLFVLGIITLTGSVRARRGHLLWAWLKFPAIVLSFFSTLEFTTAMFQSAATMTGPAGTQPAPAFLNSMAVIQATMYAVFAMVYPVALLIVMRTKRVREYYEAGAGRGMA
jgi:hypothetical protein